MLNNEANAPKQKQRGALAVRDALREDILWVRLKPGTLLDEVGLAERFGISRTPIREALLLLSGEGLVDFMQNRTTIVAPFIMDNIGDYFDAFMLLSRAAARSAATCDQVNLESLNVLIKSNLEAVKSGDITEALLTDRDFRTKIAETSNNIFLADYFRQCIVSGRRSRVLCYYTQAKMDDLLRANDLMKELVKKIAANSSEMSEQVMSELVMQDLRIIQRVFEPSIAMSMQLDEFPQNWEQPHE